jgi:hypothetical protein
MIHVGRDKVAQYPTGPAAGPTKSCDLKAIRQKDTGQGNGPPALACTLSKQWNGIPVPREPKRSIIAGPDREVIASIEIGDKMGEISSPALEQVSYVHYEGGKFQQGSPVFRHRLLVSGRRRDADDEAILGLASAAESEGAAARPPAAASLPPLARRRIARTSATAVQWLDHPPWSRE